MTTSEVYPPGHAKDRDGRHVKSNCPVCNPDREFLFHTCEHCGRSMYWADQSCACLCKANHGYVGLNKE
jgi:hypothetical protein